MIWHGKAIAQKLLPRQAKPADNTALLKRTFDVVRIDPELIELLLPEFKKNVGKYKKSQAYILGQG